MKEIKKCPYAAGKSEKINAKNPPPKNEPKAVRKDGGDLRVKKGC